MKPRARFRWSSVVAICLLLITAAHAQEFGEVAEEFRRNIDALRGFAWNSKVEIRVGGEVTRTETYRIRVDADGKVNRELISAEGKTTKQVALELHVSVKTVETHRQHLMEKIGANSVAELTKFAVREGFTSLDS